MQSHWKEFFTYNKAERKGIFILTTIIVLMILYQIVSPYLFIKQVDDFSAFEEMLIDLDLTRDSLAQQSKNYISDPTNQSKSKSHQTRLKNFDPNNASESDWQSFGLNARQIKIIKKYLSKGGRFNTPEDLRKMYCLSTGECDLLIPYVLIQEPLKGELTGFELEYSKSKTLKIIEINAADFETLLEVSGIGPSTAKSIINYRQRLGGFCCLEQLREVYSVDSARFDQIAPNFVVNTDSIHPVNINKADYFLLKKHPYMTKALAYEIIQYRKINGNYKRLEEIKNVKGVTTAIYQKINKYLSISD
jgi:competence ComEA-like helix-hairpin-helix protein